MSDDIIVQAAETFTLVGVLLAAIIFARLALKARSIGTFRFQLSIFILVWVAAEVPHIADSLGLISAGSFDDLGLAVHMISMATFALFVGVRSYAFLRIKPAQPISPITPQQTSGITGAVDT